MRHWDSDKIALWQAGGPFVGDDGAPNGYVTIEKNWQLRTSHDSDGLSTYPKVPVRWFQREANDQIETDVPNVETINIQRSVEQDAATMTFTMTNTRMFANGDIGSTSELGQPGYYSWARGASTDAVGRWDQTRVATSTFQFYPDNDSTAVFEQFEGFDVWETNTGAGPTYAVLDDQTDRTDYITNVAETSFFLGTGFSGGTMYFHSQNYTPFGPDVRIVSVEVKAHVESFTTTSQPPPNSAVDQFRSERNIYYAVPFFRIGGTVYAGSGEGLINREAYISGGNYVINPATDAAWTVADVNSMISGGSGDAFGLASAWFVMHARDVKVHGIWLEVVTEPNEEYWGDVIVPNALVRTYQGYGGKTKTREDALADGDVIQTGLWLVDEVRVTANGKLEIKCRDMSKLVIDQQLFPPLVPNTAYPIRYSRYDYITTGGQRIPFWDPNTTVGWILTYSGLAYQSSSTDDRHGTVDTSIDGHKPSDTLDGDPKTYWLSDDHSTAEGWEYIQYWGVDAPPISWLSIHTWGGGYRCYASYYKEGAWQGTNLIPNAPAGMSIPYVNVKDLNWETETNLITIGSFLAAVPGVSFVRLTFTKLVQQTRGTEIYRCGVRQVRAVVYGSGASNYRFITDGGAARTKFARFYWLTGSDGTCMLYGLNNAATYSFRLPLYDGRTSVKAVACLNDSPAMYIACENGFVTGWGMRAPYSQLGNATVGASTLAGIATTLGYGYWTVLANGTVEAFGDAVHHGNYSGGGTVVGIASKDDGAGYWVTNGDGVVQAFGSATLSTDGISSGYQNIEAGVGDSYYLINSVGQVDPKGAGAPFYGNGTIDGSPFNFSMAVIPAPQVDDGAGGKKIPGYWIVWATGRVERFGDEFETPFLGDPHAAYQLVVKTNGNYTDYVDIVKDLLLYSGFWLHPITDADGRPEVFGNIEATGAWASDVLPETMFDKVPVIDAINKIKEAIGYIFYVDSTGAAHFELPNFWTFGNFYDTGEHTDVIYEIDEELQLTDYGVSFADKSVRSEIVISSSNPLDPLTDTVTTVYIPANATVLKGLVKSAMWTNEVFLSSEEQEIMAQMIAVHSWFAQRQGSLQAAANPMFEINDQVKIWERQTGETYIHYVRGLETNMDVVSGQYSMSMTTHWLGDGTSFALGDLADLPDRLLGTSTLQTDGGGGQDSAPPGAGAHGAETGFTMGNQFTFEDSGSQTRDLNIAINTGAQWVRVDLDWSIVEATQGTYDFTAYDFIMSKFQDAGLSVIFNLTNTPPWATADGSSSHAPPADMVNFENFCDATAHHFENSVAYYEIWGRPNSIDNWATGVDAEYYVAMLEAADRAFNSATPWGTVMLGALASGDGTTDHPFAADFLADVYGFGGGGLFQAVGVSLFADSDTPSALMGGVVNVRSTMVANGDSGLDIHCLEAGASTVGAISEADQATIVTDFFSEWFGVGYHGLFFWYEPRDEGVASSTQTADRYGLVSKAWTNKTAYAQFIVEVS